MRLLVATCNARPIGGAEAHLRTLLPLLRDRGFDLAVMTFDQDDPGPDGIVPTGVPWLSAAGCSAADLVARIAKWEPTVVYHHGLGEPEFEAAVAARFRTVYNAHNYGGTCVSGNKCHAFPGDAVCDRRLGPGCLALYLPRRCGGLNPVAAVRLYRRERRRQDAFGLYRVVVVASRHMAREMARNGVPADRVHLAPAYPSAVAPDPAPPAPRPQSGRVLFLGRFTALKGWAHLLEAVPRAAADLGRPLTLVVSGDGPDRQQFEAAARRRGVPVEFLGWVDLDRRNAEMRSADVVAVPSVWPEPFGLTGTEAGCVGTPAVGYAVGGIPDWLIPGVSGESAPGGRPDPRALAAAIVRAVADPDHWQRLRVGAWETARRFTPEVHLAKLLPALEAAAP